jgi:hypothetical protein
MRILKSIVALAAVAVIVGRVETRRRPAAESRNQEPAFFSNSAAAQTLVRACGNCHSDRTDWPWYSYVAPLSWWIAGDVREGREKLNFSEWDAYSSRQKRDKLESICGLISTGRMPPPLYGTMHPEAKLTAKDKEAVCRWGKEETMGAR